ncbi:MAG: imidazole glycerol phosphate synthase subunit HisH [Burkholderiaceae bacterium]|nr:imidazole glycerol phosphate synthase subunit HisH [Burkholderiaceae bacterium]
MGIGSRWTVGIVDYRAGNVRSIANAFHHLGCEVEIVTREADLAAVTHLVLPGVGAFGHCAENLTASGLLPAITRWALRDQRPLLGICVGMQLLADVGEEMGEHAGLGWIEGRVRRLPASEPGVRLPHVGWNTVCFVAPAAGFEAGQREDFYFDHSYGFFCSQPADVVAECTHGATFAAIVRRGNILATQFHPEKSQEAGLRFLNAFLAST